RFVKNCVMRRDDSVAPNGHPQHLTRNQIFRSGDQSHLPEQPECKSAASQHWIQGWLRQTEVAVLAFVLEQRPKFQAHKVVAKRPFCAESEIFAPAKRSLRSRISERCVFPCGINPS